MLALGYLVKHRTGLGVFLDNGFVELDNNLVENRIRPTALGRRNWLFSDTERGVKASAMLNGHHPYTYLVHVFKELPMANMLEDFEALLPWNSKPDRLEKL